MNGETIHQLKVVGKVTVDLPVDDPRIAARGYKGAADFLTDNLEPGTAVWLNIPGAGASYVGVGGAGEKFETSTEDPSRVIIAW